MLPSSDPPSRTSTPKTFTNQTASAEDLLKSQTVGLVNLSDFRKRRAEAQEQKDKEAQDRSYGKFQSSGTGTTTPASVESDGATTPRDGSLGEPTRKKKKKVARKILSFGEDDDEENGTKTTSSRPRPANLTQLSADSKEPTVEPISRKLTPNPTLSRPAPKIVTKSSLQAEAQTRDALRREFLLLQEAVKATDILIPFVFYDGTNVPGGSVKVKKGDPVWLFLDRCRKVGAELGVSGGGGSGNSGTKQKGDSRREWARVGVDDLMMVRGEVIVPHHYELYYFIANRVPNPSKGGGLLFEYSNSVPEKYSLEEAPLLRRPNDNLEGKDMDPALTKVVDRRWYQKNKHIFPASMWKDFDPGKDFDGKKHIFCASCADELGLSHSSETNRHCPACRTDLPYPDDVVTTNLKPTEDYKTSVLSGLDPAIIMECASRGLAFWTYQATQEVFYQEFLGKNLTDRYGKLSTHLDKTINDANSEIDSLSKQISGKVPCSFQYGSKLTFQGLQLEKADLHKKNEELYRMYTEKTKKHQQTQHLYDTLKKRILMSQVQTAASDTVNRTVNSLTSATRPNTFTGNGVPSGRRSMPEIGDRLQHDPLLDTNGVEILHSHQRSGSASNHSADAAIMPPPERPSFHRPRKYFALLEALDSQPQNHSLHLPHSTEPSFPPPVILAPALKSLRPPFTLPINLPPAGRLGLPHANLSQTAAIFAIVKAAQDMV
ncbi:MAG: hypothetical protein Q9160_005066 [Pyrenula sp. 1 TL-2023]